METEFSTLAEAQEAFAKLSQEFQASQSLSSEAADKIAALTESAESITAQLADANAKLAEKEQAIEAAATEKAALTAEVEKLKAEAKTAEQRAAEIAANSGTAPVGTSFSDSSTMSRKDFEELSLNDRMKFFRNGGKLSE